MTEEDIFLLEMNQPIKVQCVDGIDGFFIGVIRSINTWTKLVGVVDSNNQYKEYPYRKIMKY